MLKMTYLKSTYFRSALIKSGSIRVSKMSALLKQPITPPLKHVANLYNEAPVYQNIILVRWKVFNPQRVCMAINTIYTNLTKFKNCILYHYGLKLILL